MGTIWREVERERNDAQQSGRRIFLVILITGLAFLAGRYYFERGAQPVTGVPPNEVVTPERIPSAQEIQVPRVDDAPLYQAPASESRPGAGGRSVAVYQCISDGQLVLSDRPCGQQSRVRDVVVDDPDAQEAAAAQQRTWAAQLNRPVPTAPSYQSRQQQSDAYAQRDAGAANAAQCEWYDRQIDALNSRMRQGYSSAEGEWLRAQWHDLKSRRQALKCGR